MTFGERRKESRAVLALGDLPHLGDPSLLALALYCGPLAGPQKLLETSVLHSVPTEHPTLSVSEWGAEHPLMN